MKKKKLLLISLLSVILLTGSFAIYSSSGIAPKPLLIFPPGSTYEKEWAKVDSLGNKGLTRSALDVVEGILKKAKEDANAQQIVKSLIHKMKFESYIEEDSYVKAIYDLQQEADNSFYPVKPVLHSITAEIYWRFYQRNRWKFLNRTETAQFDQKDIRTWDLKKLLREVLGNYHASLQKTDSLKRTPINTFDEILVKEYGSRDFRPTLYDFLAHRAVDFFMSEEPGITRPAYKFELDKEEFLHSPYDFVKLTLSTKDTFSLKFHALQLLQELTAFHLQDAGPKALIDVDLKRLKFVRNHSIVDIKDSLYLNALVELEKTFTNHESSAEISYEIATYYNEQGGKYKPLESDKHKWDKKTAVDICNKTIEKYPESFGAGNCTNLLASINEKNINYTVEKANAPGKPFRSLLKYRNIDTVYFRIVKVDFNAFRKAKRKKYSEELMDYFVKLKPTKEWMQTVENDKDYQEHSVEIKMPEMPAGHYLVLAGSDPEFSYDHNGIAYGNCWVTNISYLTRQMHNGSYDVYVFHRETGKPLAGASAQLYYQKYNYILRDYEYKKLTKYTTDKDGYFNVSASKDYRNFFFDFSYEGDRFNTDDNYYQYKPYRNDRMRVRTFFFTDRGIYRPGQTIYFKGIVIDTDGETNRIKTNYSTTVIMYDVNYQKVGESKLTTNEYGTVSGTFTAPTSSLNGQMHITNSYGTVYFYVEEYKRPKFEVTFEPVKGTFKLGQTVKVDGLAKAYAGSVIDGAEVQYRVVRNASFPWWCYYWWGWYPTSPEMEITNGLTTTNEKGEFNIEFTAIPDKSVPKKYRPTYNYTVYADVVDINGETHSAQQYVNVGYTALTINVDVPAELNKNGRDTFMLKTTNLMGQEEPAKGTVVIHRLKEPKKVFRARQWDRPDKFLFTKEGYYKLFPKDIYDDEANHYKWEKGTKVYDRPFDTGKSTKLTLLKLPEWQQGWYVLEALSKDKYGEEVKDLRYFKVFSDYGKEVPAGDVNWFATLSEGAVEPGGKAEFLIGSAARDVSCLYEIEHKNKVVHKEWLTLNGEQKKITIPIEEKHRGNFSVHFTFVKDNRFYSNSRVVTVPYSNKKLDIEFETFRNKLYPGQDEEWKIIIKGPKGEKVAAEMLVALYDASLDAFAPNNWYFDVYRSYYSNLYWQSRSFTTQSSYLFQSNWNTYPNYQYHYYDYLNWFGFDDYGYHFRGARFSLNGGGVMYDRAGDDMDYEMLESEVAAAPAKEASKKDKGERKMAEQSITTASGKAAGMPMAGETVSRQATGADLSAIKARKNFNETAFFYPNLETNEKGEVIVKFTIPEALTRWKFMGLAHTKDLKSGTIFEEIVTQKELMVMPNAPRFFREGDKMIFTAKVINLSKKDQTGTAQLKFFNALTMEPVDKQLLVSANNIKNFSVKKGQSTLVKWNITIPEGLGAVTYRIAAKAGKFTDAEEMAIPILTNRMLVTESLPLPMRGKQTKTFKFKKLLNSAGSTTLRHHKLTLEFSSQPAWYAIQALPYLMEYPYECSEQIFSRFYANSIASHIANSSPKIKRVFDSWRTQSPDALLSNLEKNQELKSLMLEETPWVLDAKNESERKKRVALLFDLNRMSNELGRALKKLEEAQVANGGWTWFPGMPESRYITQHIVTGFGHLDNLGVKDIRKNQRIWKMVAKAVPYLDNRIREDYEWLLRNNVDMEKNHLGSTQIQYLYARSYFRDIKVSSRNKTAFNYYMGQAKKYWLENNRYLQGMISLALHRYEVKAIPMDIIRSLKENAIFSEEMGMYWKDMYSGYYWYQAPIESQALLIEAFDEVANDIKSVDDMKVWLLKSKQTQDWKTTKATTEACYALLLSGTDWLASDQLVEISLGDVVIDPRKMDDVKVEAGTGYFKTSWSKGAIKPEMGKVTVTKKDEGVAWGALYWQYFEQLDKITLHETPLKLNKKLFLEKPSDTGPVMTLVTENTSLKPGDKLKVRIELRVDRDMEFVHMKDMRASGFEPINVISRYKWQGGLGYYESTRDAATNFFFDYLPKGTYVFEYPLRVTHEGDFSNGITTIQCMYAPEFTSHSEGIRVQVGN